MNVDPFQQQRERDSVALGRILNDACWTSLEEEPDVEKWSEFYQAQLQGAVSPLHMKLYGTRNLKKLVTSLEGDGECTCGNEAMCPLLEGDFDERRIHPSPASDSTGKMTCPVCGFIDFFSGFDGYESDEDPESFNVSAQEQGATMFCVNCNECFV